MAKSIIPVTQIAHSIRFLREQKVLLDFDLVVLYEVLTAQLKRAVNRNLGRFPNDLMFRLTTEEFRFLICQFGISNPGRGGHRHRPYAFTEQGVAMLSSEGAVRVNITIMRAFVKLRAALEGNREPAQKFAQHEERVGKHDEDISTIIDAIRRLMAPAKRPAREIGFQVRDTSPRYGTRKHR